MEWIEITEDVYFGLFYRYTDKLRVFSGFTQLENNSRFNAGMMTEWGFPDEKEPLLKRICKPESQVDVGKVTDWPSKHYIRIKETSKINS